MKTKALILAILLLTARAAAADEAELRAAAERYGYARAVVSQIERVVAEARRAGLPEEPIRKKAIEGMAKRVAPERLTAAVKLQLDRLAELQKTAPGVKQPAERDAALTALAAGLSAPSVSALAAAAPDKSNLRSALYAVGVLTTAGAEEGAAVTLVTSLQGAGYGGDALVDAATTTARAYQAGLVSNVDLRQTKAADLQGAKGKAWLADLRGFDAPGARASRPAEPPREGAAEKASARSAERERLDPPRASTTGGVKTPGTTPPPPTEHPPGDDDEKDHTEYEHDRRR